MSDMTAWAREQRIAEIRERESKATKGPWFFASHYDPQIEMLVSAELANDERDNDPVLMHGYTAPDSLIEANWEFVQHARADIPFLLEQLAAQGASVEEVARELLDQLNEECVEYSLENGATLNKQKAEIILRQHGYGAPGQDVGLRCPKCGGEVTWQRGDRNAFCQDQFHIFTITNEKDWQQFFSPVPSPESATPRVPDTRICAICGKTLNDGDHNYHGGSNEGDHDFKSAPESATKEGK